MAVGMQKIARTQSSLHPSVEGRHARVVDAGRFLTIRAVPIPIEDVTSKRKAPRFSLLPRAAARAQQRHGRHHERQADADRPSRRADLPGEHSRLIVHPLIINRKGVLNSRAGVAPMTGLASKLGTPWPPASPPPPDTAGGAVR